VPAPRNPSVRFESGAPVPHQDCWAKTNADGSPGISVRDHCLNVGCVAEALIELFSPELAALAPTGAPTLAALHDVGKVSPGFQTKCPAWLALHGLTERAARDWVGSESDHSKVSQATAQQLLGTKLTRWAAALGAHHGRVKGQSVSQHEAWEEARVALAQELIEAFGPLPSAPPGQRDAETWFVAGLISVADWIGSDEQHFPQDVAWALGQRREAARQALREIGWALPSIRDQIPFGELFPGISQPNSLQAGMLKLARGPGVYIVEGPMGFGKTEAALSAAYQLLSSGKATGIYFALPTQVTSNRIHLRMQPFVQRIADGHGVRLAHGSSWLVESAVPKFRATSPSEDGGDEDNWYAARSWFASAKRALLMPFGVGTIDQALLAVVAAKHFFVRQFALAGKVVILDEVHTYDLYTGTLVGQLVEQLRELKATVLVLSATLTEARKRELLGLPASQPVSSAYPLVSARADSGNLLERECVPPIPRTVRVKRVSGSLSVLEIVRRASRGECVLWIRNTVDEAQETYRAVREVADGVEVALLHARFPFFRREELEAEWMERLGKNTATRPPGCVLVSTQVVEQSVDIDVDLLVTDLAPTDMLLQRIGRLWRHERPSRPCMQAEVWIKTPALDSAREQMATAIELQKSLGRSARVYAPYVLLRSLEQWAGCTSLTLPGEIREILEATYADPAQDEPEAWRELRGLMEAKKASLARLALSSTLVWSQPALQDDEGVQTRYSPYPSAQVLLLRQAERMREGFRLEFLDRSAHEVRSRQWSFDVAKAMHRNLVKVALWAVRDAICNLAWLEQHVSGPTAVGVVSEDGAVNWLEGTGQTGIVYDHYQGLILPRGGGSKSKGEETDESDD
jgi:CRISPR-associated endonuclease/helicase Cas3